MTRLLIIPMPANEPRAQALAAALQAETATLELRHFPDGETYLRYSDELSARDVVIVCTLDHPDTKLVPLLFAAKTAREIGARKIGLVAPYLAYMRQDRRFHPGEAVTSRYVAELLSGAFDWLITIDPHLHRYHSLGEVYTIPNRVVQAAPLLSAWIRSNVAAPVLIGPDSESEQWVSAVAADAGAPFTVLEKTRRGDREVEIRIKDAERTRGRTPVFVDDIISSGHTMLEAIRQVRNTNAAPPVCLAVHGLFADQSDKILAAAGAVVVTTNTVMHATNAIDVVPLLSKPVIELTGAHE